jgi:hypothetical protein
MVGIVFFVSPYSLFAEGFQRAIGKPFGEENRKRSPRLATARIFVQDYLA